MVEVGTLAGGRVNGHDPPWRNSTPVTVRFTLPWPYDLCEMHR